MHLCLQSEWNNVCGCPQAAGHFARIVAALGCSFLAPAVASSQQGCAAGGIRQASLAIIPQPREAAAGSPLPLVHGVRIVMEGLSGDDRFAAEDLSTALRERGVAISNAGNASVSIVLRRARSSNARLLLERHRLAWTPVMEEEGYALIPEGHTVYDIAASGAGLFYGTQTLIQLVLEQGATACLQTATIRDWPAMKYRGISDDLSRGPVPTLAFQEHVVRTLAAHKMNVYSPYMEVAFAYAKEPLSAPPGGAMTPNDLRELTTYAVKFHVTVIPEQEAFCHLHHALMFEKYDPLGESHLG